MTTPKTPREMRQLVIDRALAANHTITDDDVSNSETLRSVAIDFIQSYTGKGYFMRSVHGELFRYGKVTIKQMRGALNAMISEYKAVNAASAGAFYVNLSAIPMPNATDVLGDAGKSGDPTDPTSELDTTALTAILTPVVPNGTYTVPINDAGEYRVIKLVDCPDSFNKPAGTQIAKYQSGADNEHNYTGFAFVNGDRYTLWRKFANAHAIEHALVKLLSTGKHAEYGRLWAMAAGQCFICGRKLTVPISKKAGIGPKCATNHGIDIVALATLAGDKDQAIEQNDLRDQAYAHRMIMEAREEEKYRHQRDAQADIDELFPQ